MTDSKNDNDDVISDISNINNLFFSLLISLYLITNILMIFITI